MTHIANKLTDPRAACFTCASTTKGPWLILGNLDLRTHTMGVLCATCTAVRLKDCGVVDRAQVTGLSAAKTLAEEEARGYLAQLRDAWKELEEIQTKLVAVEGERDSAKANLMLLEQHVRELQKPPRDQLRDAILEADEVEKPTKRTAKTAA
jgi:uncharacterized membrane protein